MFSNHLTINSKYVFTIIALTIFILPFYSQSNATAAIPSGTVKTYDSRVQLVRKTRGLAAFWDFVLREDGIQGTGKFMAYTRKGDAHRYILEPHNVSLDFWNDGFPATMDDFPLLGSGPFGQAVQFRAPKSLNDLPVLMLSRASLNDTPIDVKGPGQSVSMLVWLIYQEGDHAIAGMWHEGTDSKPLGIPAKVKVRGQRQYGLFAGLSANPGTVGAHISDNGLTSFGANYAKHMSDTKEKIVKASTKGTPAELNAKWSVVGFVYDNKKKMVTSYLDGKTSEYWIDNPSKDVFYNYAANAWKQFQLSKIEGVQKGEDVNFPKDQYYSPPEDKILEEKIVSESNEERIVIREYEFTKLKVILKKDSRGKFNTISSIEMVAIKANPYWIGKDIYSPQSESEGSPFTIGRVIHSNRHATLSAYFGGVAVYNTALNEKEIEKLSMIGRTAEYPVIKIPENQN